MAHAFRCPLTSRKGGGLAETLANDQRSHHHLLKARIAYAVHEPRDRDPSVESTLKSRHASCGQHCAMRSAMQWRRKASEPVDTFQKKPGLHVMYF